MKSVPNCSPCRRYDTKRCEYVPWIEAGAERKRGPPAILLCIRFMGLRGPY